jgi:HlyD family secretion protein
LALLAATASLLVACLAWAWQLRQQRLLDRSLPPTVAVRRMHLFSTLVEDGEVDSSEKTQIECELERVSFRNNGMSLDSNGSSRILELVPEGTMVAAGQVICRLDSSEFEEMVRQEMIELQEDRADERAAELEVETLEVALQEYRDGQVAQMRDRLAGQLALSQADQERQRDRLRWSEQMNRLGYMPLSKFSTEKHSGLALDLDVAEAETARRTFERYTAPKKLFELERQIERAKTELQFQSQRTRRDEEALALYRKQIERCTIRAPHAGLLIYSHEDDDQLVEVGATVREDQDLFFLPNLSKMQVKTRIHETAMGRVEPGMTARVKVEALQSAVLEGIVTSIAPLPISVRSWWQTNDVKNYETIVELHTIPDGLRPGMTAQVEILTSSRPDALVVPPYALTMDEGREVCYVLTPQATIERREVEVGEVTPAHLEILSGLAEGEAVVANPSSIPADRIVDPDPSSVAHAATERDTATF